MTTHEIEGESNVWRLDAAHLQMYTLSSPRCGGTLGPFPYVTDNARQSDQIVLQRIDEGGTVRLYHKSWGQYLRSCVEGEVCCNSCPTNSADPSDLWRMEQRPGPEGGTPSPPRQSDHRAQQDGKMLAGDDVDSGSDGNVASPVRQEWH